MAEEFYKGSSEKVVGGAARLLLRVKGSGPIVSDFDDVIDRTPGANNAAINGFWDLGYTTDGVTQSRGFDTEDTEVDQRTAPIDTTVTGTTNTVSSTLMEDSIENRQVANVGSMIEVIPPVLGAATTLVADVNQGATNLKLTSVEGVVADGHIMVDGTYYAVSKVDTTNSIVYLKKATTEAYTAVDAEVSAVTKLGYSKINYGSIESLPEFELVILSRKANKALYMAYYYRVTVAGDDKERNFDKAKRQLPISFNAYPEDGLPDGENILMELEENAI